MSASTLSITTRRRSALAGDKKTAETETPAAGAAAGDPNSAVKDLSRSFSGEASPETAKTAAKKPPPTTASRRTHRRTAAAPPLRPKWATVVSVLTKNLLLLLVLFGFVQIVRKLAYNTDKDGFSVTNGIEFERRIADVEGLVKKTTRMLQVQVEVVDKKLDKGLIEVKMDLNKKIDAKNRELGEKMERFDTGLAGLEKVLGELKNGGDWVKRDDLDGFLEEFRKNKGGVGEMGLDEVREVAREVVERELRRHAADGLGRVDYAVASGGAMVVRHSEQYGVGRGIGWFNRVKNGVHEDSVKMISPSFGEPGQCFPLKGSSGFVQIKLRTAIVPEAVTLEHVAKSVAFDRSSAPKDCKISGRLHKHEFNDQAIDAEKMILLTEFTYDLEKSNAQTFDVLDTPIVVDTIRLDFTSNHGNPAHTCIYRLRVHGRDAESIPEQS